MKVFILTDLEGPAGVNARPDNVGNKIINRPTAEQALVNEVNAVCEGLVAAGADEIVVLDGHGGSNAIDIFKLHPKASLMQVGNYSPAVYLDGSYEDGFQTFVARSTDLKNWVWSEKNPVLTYDEEDRMTAVPFNPEFARHIAEAENINASDMDMCDYRGKLEIVYSWGCQRGIEFLARAESDLTEKEFCEYFFK
jgi:hypothetical protein